MKRLYTFLCFAALVSCGTLTKAPIIEVSESMAVEIMSEFVTTPYIAFPNNNQAIAITFVGNTYHIYIAEYLKKEWTIKESFDYQTNGDGDIKGVFDTQYEKNGFLIAGISAEDSYTYISYNPGSKDFAELIFSGKKLADGKIEGTSNESFYGQSRVDVNLLYGEMDTNPRLVRIPNDILISDLAVQDWLEANPNATTKATKVTISILPAESSLIPLFEKSKKQSSAKYTAAIIDERGYTLIIAKQKSNGDYLLVWAEPECKDHQNDRLLNSIYFSDASTMKMSYYHGRKTFSYYLNLSSKVLKR